MIGPKQLVPGRYYEVTFGENSVFLVQADTNEQVEVLYYNGLPDKGHGTVGGSNSIVEVSESYAKSGGSLNYSTNKEAANLLLDEEW